MKTSPFTVPFPRMPEVRGVRLAVAQTRMRYKGRNDLLLVELAEGTNVAGVLTKNTMPGAPVDWCRAILPRARARALVVNAGVANVFTGKPGAAAVRKTAAETAKLLRAAPEDIYISSTGIIGRKLEVQYILDALPGLREGLSPSAWELAAHAVMTTDTFPKGAARRARIGGATVTINGFAKGSGMIAPDMATMLAYVFTDAKLPAKLLQSLLNEAVRDSFNSITVDSDTSTSDTLLFFATGRAEHQAITKAGDPALKDFRVKLRSLCVELAQMVVRDGEGISMFVTVRVTGAKSRDSARKIGLAIANSPLVKTAIAGRDPNWGRLATAIGKSGEPAKRDKTSIWLGDILVAKNGMQHSSYSEAVGAAYMKEREIVLRVDVGIGKGEATVWTCDLTHDYISINADYRS